MKVFYLMEDITEATTKQFAEFLTTVSDGETVQIEILSHGGLVFAGLGFVQLIQIAQARAVKFNARIYGICASAAADIALACDHIAMAEGSQLMIHSAWGGDSEGISIANAEQLLLIHKRLPEYSEEQLKSDRFFSADEALRLGLCDEIIQASINTLEAACVKLAAMLCPCKEEIMENEEKKEQQVCAEEQPVEEEKKEQPAAEGEIAEDVEVSIDDVVERLAEKIAQLEERLAALEAPAPAPTEASAKRKAILAKMNAVIAPVPAEPTPVRAEAIKPELAIKDFASIMKSYMMSKD